jgi:hypothetical protein
MGFAAITRVGGSSRILYSTLSLGLGSSLLYTVPQGCVNISAMSPSSLSVRNHIRNFDPQIETAAKPFSASVVPLSRHCCLRIRTQPPFSVFWNVDRLRTNEKNKIVDNRG